MSVTILTGDCRDVLPTLEAGSFDSCVTDPPYGLSFMGKAWDHGVPGEPFWREVLRVLKPGAHLLAFGGTRTFHRLTCAIEDAGFEIRDCIGWIYSTGFPKSLNLDREFGHVFCGCGTSDDQMRGVRQSSHAAGGMGAESESADLFETLQRQAASRGAQSSRVQANGAGRAEPEASGGKQPGVEGWHNVEASEGQLQGRSLYSGAEVGVTDGAQGRIHHGTSPRDGGSDRAPTDANRGCGSLGPQPGQQRAGEPDAVPDQRRSQTWRGWSVCAGCGKPVVPSGLGTALKPAWEPIIVARKPLSGTVAANVQRYGTGAINVDGCRVGHNDTLAKMTGAAILGGASEGWDRPWKSDPEGLARRQAAADAAIEKANKLGRWPANLIHDGSEDVVRLFPDEAGGGFVKPYRRASQDYYSGAWPDSYGGGHGDTGSAARFFYAAKASREDREEWCDALPVKLAGEATGGRKEGSVGLDNPRAGASRGTGARNHHPTVKPTDLMRYLCRLVTPPGGLILDPFAGSGSTAKAALAEGFRCVSIELDPEYAEIIRRRARGQAGPPL